MKSKRLAHCIAIGSVLLVAPLTAWSWFVFFPIPNLAKPPALQQLIDALEKSSETRAVAFVSEDKTFGGKYWVWGNYAGEVSQEEANRYALERCEQALRNAKSQSAGGQPLYDFGAKTCELHPFTPNEGPKIAEAKKKAAEEARRQAAEEEAKRLAAAEEAKRIAAEEAKKKAVEEEAQKKAEDEARRIAEEEAARNARSGSKKANAKAATRNASATTSQGIDFNVEATKAARILGCEPAGTKVIGVEDGNIQYQVACGGAKTLLLSCDSSGLCLQKKSAAKR